jgi:hypothetical protein
MVASTWPRETRCPVSETRSCSIQPANRVWICASPRSFAVTNPTVLISGASSARSTRAVRIPMSWTRSGVSVTAASPSEMSSSRERPCFFSTRVMLQIGQSPGWSCTTDGCIGQ